MCGLGVEVSTGLGGGCFIWVLVNAVFSCSGTVAGCEVCGLTIGRTGLMSPVGGNAALVNLAGWTGIGGWNDGPPMVR